MKPALYSILLCTLAMWVVPATAQSPASALPASLAAPAGQSTSLTLEAKGVQIYECRAKADGSGYEWVFKAPEADLFDAMGKKVGRHYAGPTWELAEGGKVTGSVKAKSDSPNGAANIPWLLLEADAARATGSLAQVRSIQRVNTVGGVAPATKPDASQAGRVTRVDYTATYHFYVAKP